ncbi:hypothetical protein [Streptomyces sp. NPDC006638]
MTDQTESTQLCTGCGGPIAVPARRFHGEQEAVRHIGVPGEPAACPE